MLTVYPHIDVPARMGARNVDMGRTCHDLSSAARPSVTRKPDPVGDRAGRGCVHGKNSRIWNEGEMPQPVIGQRGSSKAASNSRPVLLDVICVGPRSA